MKKSLLLLLFSVSINAMEVSKINYIIRKATMQDENNLSILYKKVASAPGGLARTEDEITENYVHKTLYNGVHNGLALVVEHEERIIGCMIKYHLEPKTFSHVLAEGSVLIDPGFQGKGIGGNLITTFLKEIETNHPNILRVEIIARESNPAIKLYERLQFKKEGRFEQRIKGINQKFEADIPMAWFNPNFKQ